MSNYEHNSDTVAISNDGDIWCMEYNMMTASGLARVSILFDSEQEAVALRHQLISEGTLGTDGYERHTAPV